MRNFLLGALVASAIWAGIFAAQAAGIVDLFGSEDAEIEAAEDAGAPAAKTVEEEPARKKRRGKWARKKRRPRKGSGGWEAGEGTSGDDLGGDGARDLDFGGSGGEARLSPAQIDRGIDQVFNGIQRCLVLVPPGAPATGKVVLGMRISPSGKVAAVNLKGPNDIIKGECGACIRRAVKSIDFPTFDGPEMTARYPITFE